MKNKIIAMFLIAALAVSLMAGCGNKPTGTGKVPNTEAESMETGSENTESTEFVSEEPETEADTEMEEDTEIEVSIESDVSEKETVDTEIAVSDNSSKKESTNSQTTGNDTTSTNTGTTNTGNTLNEKNNTGNTSTGNTNAENNSSEGNNVTGNNNASDNNSTVTQTPTAGTATQKPSDSGNTGSNVNDSMNTNMDTNNGSTSTENTSTGNKVENNTVETAPVPQTSKEAFDLINAERVKLGLEPAVWDEECERIALIRAQELYELGYITDENAHAGFQDFWWENPRLSECVAWGFSIADGAVVTWMYSDGHRDILMDEIYTHLAVARCGNKWVAINRFIDEEVLGE